MKDTPKLNEKLLTPEQRDKLETYHQTKRQLQVLEDIADMTQELIQVFDKQGSTSEKRTDDMGSLLMDMRESLNAIKNKKDPDTPDYAEPVVKAVEGLEKALSKAIKGIDVKPVVNAPQVNVAPPGVDLKGVEKAIAQIPKAFSEAIKQIPKVEIPEVDNGPLLQAWEGISEQLISIENATRLKPLPGSIAVSNLDEITGGALSTTGPFLTKPFDRLIVTYTDSTKTVISTVVSKLAGVTQETLTNTVSATVDDFQRT